MRKYICMLCGFEYDPEKGLPEQGIAPGTPFEDLPANFECPLCGAGKSEFERATDSVSGGNRAVVDKLIKCTPSILTLRIRPLVPLIFKPGQHLKVTLRRFPELARFLSISSSPTEEGYIEVTKRITDSDFSEALSNLTEGQEIWISDPMGVFTFQGEYSKVCLLSGGIGITPFRSICKYITDKKLSTDVYLLYANRSLDEIAFKRDFDDMVLHCPTLKVVHTISRECPGWTGNTGRINANMIKTEVPEYTDRTFFVCGPPSMVDSLTQMLNDQLHIPLYTVKVEHFDGY